LPIADFQLPIRGSMPPLRNQSAIRNRQSVMSFDLDRLRSGVRPFRLHWFPRLRSTNDHAAEMRRRGNLFAPAVVLTGHQTAGRGRGQNVWWSGPGCLTVTFVLPVDEQTAPHQLPLVAGLAVRNAAAELTGDHAVQLKWPNDVLFDRRKLAGLLCERVHGADLVGLGLNVNLDPAKAPPALRRRVTSLSAVAGKALDMTTVLSVVAGHLHRAVSRRAEEPFSVVLREYDAHHALVGRTVTVIGADSESPVGGRCEGLDEMGRLVLRSRGKLHRVISGQVAVG
jgi:BirA family biotin operon repressor/biotin-[acetyl-CoA-carboxylase] ligase